MTVYGAVFARGGSKGIPSKNLQKIGGTSLLELSVTAGLQSPHIDLMLCSTDSPEIAAEASRLGATVPFERPSKLASDTAPEWAAWRHLAGFLIEQGASDKDLLVSLPTTSPLRSSEDIDSALAVFTEGAFDLVLGVSETNRSPWFNMVSRATSGEVSILVEPSDATITRRQDVPEAFDITTVVYVTTLGFVLRSDGLFGGTVGSVVIPRERAVDVDSYFDLDVAEYLMDKRRRGSGSD